MKQKLCQQDVVKSKGLKSKVANTSLSGFLLRQIAYPQSEGPEVLKDQDFNYAWRRSLIIMTMVNYLFCFAHVSFRPTVRLKTSFPGRLS
jgi:hypothetical protein